jgi:hypothetical protein
MRSLVAIFAYGLASAAAEPVRPSAEVMEFASVQAAVVALTHLRVVDGTGAAARENQTVISATASSAR